ncbi:MAG: UDP-N-acetylglucosamine 1-carboxyvinyltransferase [bacterium]|nr:UDP-N-acetylglucosamine 1-carboxyvinyltransferase [bacterium]
MDKFVINGGKRLSGEVEVEVSKNAVLPMLAAALLADGTTVFEDVPGFADIETMAAVLQSLGCGISFDDGDLAVDASTVNNQTASYDLVRRMRASISVLGPLLARFGRAEVSLPGGCAFGPRPVDLHLKAMEELGADISLDGGYIKASAKKLTGAKVFLEGPNGPSRGATANLLCAACLAEGITVIEGAAREPETVDLANLLIKMGAKITGAGGSEITIEGVNELRPVRYEAMRDQIVAGSYLIAGAITGGEVKAVGADADYLAFLLNPLSEMGATIETGEGWVKVSAEGTLSPAIIHTKPYPGFATDLQPQMMALTCTANGRSVFIEGIYPDRFNHVPELVRLGADITVEGNTAIVDGVDRFTGAYVMASDLRAAASLVLAGLAAEGETNVRRIYHLDRGYDRMEEKLNELGADIARVGE